MKVKELIKELEKHSKDMEVGILIDGDGFYESFEKLEMVVVWDELKKLVVLK